LVAFAPFLRILLSTSSLWWNRKGAKNGFKNRDQTGTIIWDDKVRGFNARRQFSEIITFSVYFRTQEGQQRFFKIGRYPIFTPTEARKQAIRVLQNPC